MASEDIIVTRFREYIRINTMQPNPDYVGAEKFIKDYGEELGLGKYLKCKNFKKHIFPPFP